MRCSRRSGVLIGSCMVLFAGCTSGSSSDADGAADAGVDVAASAGTTGADSGSVASGLAAASLARWGSGRPVLARYDPAGERTAVVTTVEIASHGADGAVTTMGGELVEAAAELVLSDDGRQIATAGEASGTVHVWDLATGEAVGAPFTADGPVNRLEFASDGSALVVGTAASVTSVPLDGSAPAVLVEPDEPTSAPLGPAAFAPDDAWIVAPLADPDVARIALWRSDGVSTIDLPITDGVGAREAIASPTGVHVGVVTAARDDPFEARLVIWDVVAGVVTGTIPIVDGGAGSRWAFGPDDRLLVADGPTTTIWSAAGETVTTLDIPPEVPVQSVLGIGDGRGFVTVLQDGTIATWDGDGGRLSTAGEPGTTLVDVTVAPDGNSVTTVDFFGAVTRWDIAGRVPADRGPVVVVEPVGVVNSVSFAPDGSAVALATSAGRVDALDDNGVVIRSFDQPQGNVDSVAFSPDSTVIASALGERRGPESFDDTVTIFDARSGTESARFGGEAEQVAGCAFFRNEVRFSPSGTLLAANSHDFTVSLYDASSGQIVHTFPAHLGTVTDLAFSPDGALLATTSDDSTLRIWNVADRQLVNEFPTPAGGYWSLVFGGDGRSLVVSDLIGTVSVLDLGSGSVVRTFAGQKNRLAELAISPDGSLVASGGDDNSVELWSTSTGELLAQLPGHTSPVRTVAFSPDGTRLASGSSDATVRLWSLQGA